MSFYQSNNKGTESQNTLQKVTEIRTTSEEQIILNSCKQQMTSAHTLHLVLQIIWYSSKQSMQANRQMRYGKSAHHCRITFIGTFSIINVLNALISHNITAKNCGIKWKQVKTNQTSSATSRENKMWKI